MDLLATWSSLIGGLQTNEKPSSKEREMVPEDDVPCCSLAATVLD